MPSKRDLFPFKRLWLAGESLSAAKELFRDTPLQDQLRLFCCILRRFRCEVTEPQILEVLDGVVDAIERHEWPTMASWFQKLRRHCLILDTLGKLESIDGRVLKLAEKAVKTAHNAFQPEPQFDRAANLYFMLDFANIASLVGISRAESAIWLMDIVQG